eukprot:11090859-Alexandrium_andersonii.AAC.1
MSASLVGSEMCIRDRSTRAASWTHAQIIGMLACRSSCACPYPCAALHADCLLYTSDAADDM